ncbi:MAG: CDP-alcohol phosphatidyltransferase family protein [Candidatus Omnitrophica bacterium]|nr:CDP-alcohol phosphatidyltransferase family protein [Candidatus Omnitrophota bacterium]
MITVYDLKPRFQKILQPTMQYLIKKGVTPNIVTFMALLGSFLVAIFSIILKDRAWILLILPMWLFIRMALNAIDGMMARQFNLSSRLGAVLNETGDILSDIFLYLSLIVFYPGVLWAIYLFVILAILTEFCGVLGQALGVGRCYDGPMGKSDRAFFVGLLAVISFIFPSVFKLWSYFFYGVSFLSILTCWNRLRHSLKSREQG